MIRTINLEEVEMLIGVKYGGAREFKWSEEDNTVTFEHDNICEVDVNFPNAKATYDIALQNLGRRVVESEERANNVAADYAAVVGFLKEVFRGDVGHG